MIKSKKTWEINDKIVSKMRKEFAARMSSKAQIRKHLKPAAIGASVRAACKKENEKIIQKNMAIREHNEKMMRISSHV